MSPEDAAARGVAPAACHDAFLSYAREDSAFAVALSGLLRRGGFDIWVDRERIAGGKPVDAEIVGALRDSAALLCLVSPSWLKKDYCLWEAEVFSNDFGFMRPIIPLLRMPRDPAKLPRYLIRLN